MSYFPDGHNQYATITMLITQGEKEGWKKQFNDFL